jgi:hypothetical protein
MPAIETTRPPGLRTGHRRARVAADEIEGAVVARELVFEALAQVVRSPVGAEPLDECLAARRPRRRDVGTEVRGDLDRESSVQRRWHPRLAWTTPYSRTHP